MNKRNLKQALALLAAITMMSCAAACGAGTEAVGTASGDVPQITAEVAAESESTEVSQETETATEMKTIEPPEDGWTKEQLNEVMYLCGEPFSLPCKLEDFEKYFTLGDLSEHTKEDTEWVPDELDKVYDLNLYTNIDGEEVVGSLRYYEGEDKSKNVYAVGFLNPYTYEEDITISVNGLNCFSDSSEVKEKLGDSSTVTTKEIGEKTHNTFYFDIKSDYDDEKMIILTADDRIIGISFLLYE